MKKVKFIMLCSIICFGSFVAAKTIVCPTVSGSTFKGVYISKGGSYNGVAHCAYVNPVAYRDLSNYVVATSTANGSHWTPGTDKEMCFNSNPNNCQMVITASR